MGRVYYVEDFDIKDDDGEVITSGDNIVAFICDRRWFKIENKDMFMDEFYNANNRSWQSYLNVIKAFNFSFFANAKMYVKAAPTVNVSSMVFADGATTSVAVSANKTLTVNTTPFPANQTITYALGAGEDTYASIEKTDNKHVKVTGLVATTGTSDVPAYVTITATAGEVTTSIKVTVTAS